MSFEILTSVATMIFCSAVLVQSVRMMRSLRAVKDGALTEVVGALDASTAQARVVLSELRETLHDCAASARTFANGREIAEELSVMIGIANATAERLVDAASSASGGREHEEMAA